MERVQDLANGAMRQAGAVDQLVVGMPGIEPGDQRADPAEVQPPGLAQVTAGGVYGVRLWLDKQLR